MPVTHVNGINLYYAFLAGAIEVSNNRGFLNRINVFPVFDSDTGNNLSTTFNYMVDTVKPSKDAGKTIRSLADASLSGARGNSGIILAQFLNGLSSEIGEEEQFSAQNFGRSVIRAVPYAYNAISKPVEGTMLTLLKDWAEELNRLSEETNDFTKILAASLERARISLLETPQKLKILKDAAVLDAGAQGLVLFLEGVVELLQKGNIKSLIQQKIAPVEIEEFLEGISGDIKLRYCSEALITGNKIDHQRIKKSVEDLGDSLIVAGTTEKVKIHMHTNYPEQFFFNLHAYGTITMQKVDDMLKQYQVTHQRKYDIALVTDSIADLPQEIFDDYQIHMIPINLNIEGSSYLDKLSIKPDQIYSILDQVEEYPTSSQPTFAAVEQALSFLCNHYKSVIMISVSQELSGTWNVFNNAAEKLRKTGNQVSVINSRLNSGAQGLLVLKAAELIAAGHEHDYIVQKVEQSIAKTKIFVSVATFKYMVRGGRVSPMKGRLAKLLNLKPIVSLDEKGKGIAFKNALTRRSNTKKILSIVENINNKSPVSKYCIVHASAPEKALSCRELFTSLLDKEPEYVVEISPIVALSAGIGAVAVCLMGETDAAVDTEAEAV